MSFPQPSRAVSLCLVPLMLLAGCGYHAGLAPALPPRAIPEEALESGARMELEGAAAMAREASVSQSIGIQIFGNESLLPNLERDLHAAFTQSARRHAALRLVSPRSADLFIRGRIANFRRGGGARTSNNRAVETLEIITIEAELIDGTTGKVLGRAQAQPVVGSAIDVPGREVDSRERALANAADRLLLLLLAGLEYGVARPGDPLLPENRPPSEEEPGGARLRELNPDLPTALPPSIPATDTDSGPNSPADLPLKDASGA